MYIVVLLMLSQLMSYSVIWKVLLFVYGGFNFNFKFLV
jgi:hypothetical protein